MKQIFIRDVNHLNDVYEHYDNWKQSFLEALGLFMTGMEYLTIDDTGVYMSKKKEKNCDVCGSSNIVEHPHMGVNCNFCN